MKVVKEGDKVHLLYETKLEDGTILHKNKKENPLGVVVGEGKIFSAIENQIKDMKQGETKTIPLKPEEAFGKHREDLIFIAPKNKIKTDDDLVIGSRIKLKMSSGKEITGTITGTDGDNLKIDFNHPLAGRNILFTLTVLSIG